MTMTKEKINFMKDKPPLCLVIPKFAITFFNENLVLEIFIQKNKIAFGKNWGRGGRMSLFYFLKGHPLPPFPSLNHLLGFVLVPTIMNIEAACCVA